MILKRLIEHHASEQPADDRQPGDLLISWRTTTKRGCGFATIMKHYEAQGFMVLSWNNDLGAGTSSIHIRPYPPKEVWYDE